MPSKEAPKTEARLGRKTLEHHEMKATTVTKVAAINLDLSLTPEKQKETELLVLEEEKVETVEEPPVIEFQRPPTPSPSIPEEELKAMHEDYMNGLIEKTIVNSLAKDVIPKAIYDFKTTE